MRDSDKNMHNKDKDTHNNNDRRHTSHEESGNKPSSSYFWESILDAQRLALLPILHQFTNEHAGWYLAGGTALAAYFGHRISIDFDFFTCNHFQPNSLLEKLHAHCDGQKITVLHSAENTLTILLDDVKVSFMSYTYPLLKPLQKTQYFDIASIEDIACMKFSAIQGRKTQKDYVDIAYLTKKLSLAERIQLYEKKYNQTIQDTLFIKYLLATDTLDTTHVEFTNPNINRITCVEWIQKWVRKEIDGGK